MQGKINPVVGVIIALVVFIVVGAIGWKIASAPRGVQGKIPASASNPNGYMPPPGSSGGGGSAGR
jgi:hypothetical protein